MTRVCVVGEGQTEQEFVNEIIRPLLGQCGISIYATLIPTSSVSKGGALGYERVQKFLLNTLKQDKDLYVTTFFDLYALKADFPKYAEAENINDIYQRVAWLEEAIKNDLEEKTFINNRFIPYIQPYEFEALLFCDVTKIITLEKNWLQFERSLLEIQKEYLNPELMNGGYDTHPSARLKKILILPKFNKPFHGVRAIIQIGFDQLLKKCPHFNSWYNSLLNLKPR